MLEEAFHIFSSLLVKFQQQRAHPVFVDTMRGQFFSLLLNLTFPLLATLTLIEDSIQLHCGELDLSLWMLHVSFENTLEVIRLSTYMIFLEAKRGGKNILTYTL